MNANLTLSDVVFLYFLTSSHAISTAWLLVKKLKKNIYNHGRHFLYC